jgi:hypothetical protein
MLPNQRSRCKSKESQRVRHITSTVKIENRFVNGNIFCSRKYSGVDAPGLSDLTHLPPPVSEIAGPTD